MLVFGLSLSFVNFLGVGSSLTLPPSPPRRQLTALLSFPAALTLGGGVLYAWHDALDAVPPLPMQKILPD